MLPMQLSEYRNPPDGKSRAPSTGHATRAPPFQLYYPRPPPTYKDVPPNHPIGQLILNTMNRISDNYRTYLELAIKLDQMDAEVQVAYKNTLMTLEQSMRSDQDNVEEWERQLGLFPTPRVI